MDAWTALREWWLQTVPEALDRLGPPADARALDAAEREMNVDLPADYRAWILAHDGADYGLFPRDAISSIDGVLSTWRLHRELFSKPMGNRIAAAPGVRAVWSDRCWIPITSDGAGNHLCIDLDPGPGGEAGQIVQFWHDGGERPVVAKSLSAWFEAVHAQLVSGDVVVTETEGVFDGVLRRSSLTGSLVTARIRGETDDDYRARIAHEKQTNRGWVIVSIIGTLIRYRLVELKPDRFEMILMADASEALGTIAWWALAERFHRTLLKHRDVARVTIDVDTLGRVLEAFPFEKDVLGPRRSA